MALSLKVISPSQKIYEGNTDEVILPSTTGQLGILPGHISLVTAIDVGVLKLRNSTNWDTIALMGGFAEVEDDEVTVLVNSAEMGSSIDIKKAEAEFASAKANAERLSNEDKSPEKFKAETNLNKARVRVQAAKPFK